MPRFFHYDLTVSDSEIDELGHANNAVYLNWLQRAAIAHSTANGWGMERYRELGTAWIARAHSIEYLKPAYAGDQLSIRTWVSGAKRVSSWRRYEVTNTDTSELIVFAETRWVFVDLDSLRPSRVPAVFWDDFEIVDDSESESQLGSIRP